MRFSPLFATGFSLLSRILYRPPTPLRLVEARLRPVTPLRSMSILGALFGTSASSSKMTYPDKRSEDEWRAVLSKEQFRILREKGTEAPGSGTLNAHYPEHGVYSCAGCCKPLYKASHKFKSGCGWPAYFDSIPGAVTRHEDRTLGTTRTEIVCSNCGGHLGHVFKGEGYSTPTDERHCVNTLERLSQIGGQLSANISGSGRQRLLEKRSDDVVVVACCRSAFTKGGKGGFKDTQAADIMAGVLREVADRARIDKALVEDICVGTVLAPGGGATEMRAASFVAGYPETTAVRTLNRQCSSGLQACVDVANQIKTGMIEVGIGAGVESMSLHYGPSAVTEFSESLENNPEAANCKVPMGVLSEDMAKDLNITRADQDAFAASSYQKAVQAQRQGLFDEEIVPLKARYEDPKSGETKEITVAKDDGIRDGITPESLGKIRPAFAADGSIHAGNASQISDGAAAVLMMRRSTSERLGLSPIGKFVCAAVVGVKPLLMGQGPWKAIPRALELAGIAKDDVDIFEINEAFASQCLWCANQLGIPHEKINPKGGAIAFGHPLGCTGARQVSTLLYELRRTGKKVGNTSMCVGTGMGMSAVWVAE
ncbi:hypothetical protein CDD80_1743 [Ophiocordyceps camponoti-rufipedis]|uniref:MsrB domain-containing protein n=1 Tax=Ophiocordyceps camponoti-rufipedis TaxID=2004952 RepID=A0A2C5YDM7_9HYPO|nr:hypothetical protein CDD80_1743 [Ophiocordyceps camponoti-rufipedis]